MTLHFQNDVHDVIARRKVLPPGDWKQRLPARAVPGLWYIRTCYRT